MATTRDLLLARLEMYQEMREKGNISANSVALIPIEEVLKALDADADTIVKVLAVCAEYTDTIAGMFADDIRSVVAGAAGPTITPNVLQATVGTPGVATFIPHASVRVDATGQMTITPITDPARGGW